MQDLLRLLLELFGPILRRLLEDLLSRAATDLDRGEYGTAAEAVGALFDRARGKTWFWQAGRRRLLAAAERVVLARALERAARTGEPLEPLTAAEQQAIADAM